MYLVCPSSLSSPSRQGGIESTPETSDETGGREAVGDKDQKKKRGSSDRRVVRTRKFLGWTDRRGSRGRTGRNRRFHEGLQPFWRGIPRGPEVCRGQGLAEVDRTSGASGSPGDSSPVDEICDSRSRDGPTVSGRRLTRGVEVRFTGGSVEYVVLLWFVCLFSVTFFL